MKNDKPQHTQETWKVAHYTRGILKGVNFIANAEGVKICTMNPANPSDYANACVIASSLKTLKALKEVYACILNRKSITVEIFDNIKKVIDEADSKHKH